MSFRQAIKALGLLGGALLMTTATAAQERTVSVTVYNTDLGAVRDERVLEMRSGRDTLRFTDVPARIDPTSVHLEATDGRDLEVLEQNYVYDLVSPSAVLDRYIDREIFVKDEDGEAYDGVLLSHTGDQLLLAPPSGEVVLLRNDRIAEVRCPDLPGGLTTRPTLVWLLDTSRGGERRARVSYLTGGMSWEARYVAVVNDDESKVQLSAWVNVKNESGTTLPNASLQLVAGDVNRVREEPTFRAYDKQVPMAAAERAGFEQEAFFEYHLYSLERTTTLADNETKQISLFPPADVAVSKEYEFAVWKGAKVRVVVAFDNSAEDGLGIPLPRGIVRVYKADRRERLQFIGEDRIDHTPKDEEIRLYLGDAFDLVGERKVMDHRRISQRVSEEDVEISLRNRKDSGTVEIIVLELLRGDWEILRSSVPHEQKDATKAEFRVSVPAGEEVVLTYTVRYR